MMDDEKEQSTEQPTVLVAVRLPTSMNIELQELVGQTGVSKSAYIKLALADLLRKLKA